MSDLKISPTPWRPRKEKSPTVWAADDCIVADCDMSVIIDDDQKAANMHLCAAAPRLYASLLWCMAQFEGESGMGINYWEELPEYNEAVQALADARGEGDHE